MRKAIIAFFMSLASLMMFFSSAQAASPTASAIFSGIGGTTTIDQGGAIHSQTRSIYSLGGGMTSFQGKRVSLLAVDPPNFSAGCAGISWHFGGFAFISMDEIRQLIEAIAQASLGVAVDLAMQVLCPQCYAVMSKLRELSNMMRNAAADACRVATAIGKAVLEANSIQLPDKTQQQCGTDSAKSGKTTGFLNSVAGAFCGTLDSATKFLADTGGEIERWMKGVAGPNDKTPDSTSIAGLGNVTYRALGALGYEDGFAKNVILSLLGMSIVYPTPVKDCSETFKHFRDSGRDEDESAIAVITRTEAARTVKKTDPNAEVTAEDASKTTNTTKKNPGDTEKNLSACHAPPLITDVKEIAKLLLCGVNPKQNAELFAANYYGGDESKFKATSMAMMCPTDKETVGTDSYDFYIYNCRGDAKTKDCIDPKMERFGNYAKSIANLDGYDGLVYMIGAKLFNGVLAVRDGQPLPPSTVQIIQAVDYPLYRLINLAAVYPGAAGSALEAYGATIATQYVSDTLGMVVKMGSQPAIDFRNQIPVGAPIVNQLRSELAHLLKGDLINKNQTLTRLSEKRALVDMIIQSNKALQSEVISQGLGSNAEMALSLRLQAESKKTSP